MVVIWGLDLKEIQWYKFKSSYMFKNTDYHLRRTKFVVYQLAMTLLVVSESLGTAVLSDYGDEQSAIEERFPGIQLHNDDYIGIAGYNIFVGVFAAWVFGAAFFFDLIWPLRYEPASIQWAWQICSVLVCVAGIADVVAYTVILTRHSVGVTGIENLTPLQQTQLQQQLDLDSSKTPLLYHQSERATASLVLLWLGWVAAIASTYVMLSFYRHVRATGSAKASHVLRAEKIELENQKDGSV